MKLIPVAAMVLLHLVFLREKIRKKTGISRAADVSTN